MTRHRLGVLASHPIQYQAPLFRELARRLDLTVYYAHRQTPQAQADAGFGVPFDWDVDLLSGYEHRFLNNVAARPDASSFFGCDTPQVAGEIHRGRFDGFLVMGWNLKSYWQAIQACRRNRVPVMGRGDSTLGRSTGFLKSVAKRLVYPAMLRKFDAHLYVGRRNREYLEHFGVDAARLFFAPHCVDNERFATAARQGDRARLRASLGIADREKVILFVGKLINIKRPGDLVRALALLKHRGGDLKGVFVGDGPLRAPLETLCRELDVPAVFTGFRNQSLMPELYAAADVLAAPSQAESWGLVVNEALATGTGAVVSDAVGCAPDLLEDPRVGRTFPVGDVPALAAALGQMLEQQADQAAIRQVIERYSVRAAAGGVLQALVATARARSR